MDKKINYYNERLHNLRGQEKLLRKELRIYSIFRLISFLLIASAIFIFVPKNTLIGICISSVSMAIFLSLIKVHLRKGEKHNHIKELIQINSDEVQGLNYKYGCFNPGAEFINSDHAFSFDLDLFGEGSLFQFLNRTVTISGRKKLAGWLTNENLNTKKITDKQEAVKELSGYNELLQDFRAKGAIWTDKEGDIAQLNNWVNKPVFYLKRNVYLIFILLLPVSILSAIVAAFFISGFFNLVIVLFFIQLVIVAIRVRHTNAEHALIGKRLDALKKYYHLLSQIEKIDFKSNVLKKISSELISGEFSAAKSINDLTRIVSAFDLRLNFLAAIFLEGFLLWDIRCMVKLEKWKAHQGHHLNRWIDAIAEFDALVSLSTFSFNHPEFIFPDISESTIIHSKNTGHVLIPEDQRVCNDFQISDKGNFVIITGANMAGKSTFLRTIATNMVLAMAGAPVCASVYIFKPVKIYSSMRTSDSLNKNESYFFAELKRLKEMLDKIRAGEELFIILDEILKGTNSTDKQKGSMAALEQILKYSGTGIIATHDLELTKIENRYPDKIRNMCFEIEIDRAEISFDYKLREGVTTKMNASILMRQMGIIFD
jgi:DNA mismatch repair ATPase MutS